MKEIKKSGQLNISDDGKLILTGEVFDTHGYYIFDAAIDTGASLGITLTQELADAVCAPVVEARIPISIGAGSNSIEGCLRKVNLRFGGLEVKNYTATVIKGTRNLIGIKFLQEAGILLVADFHREKTLGSFISSDRNHARLIGKTFHCVNVHNFDICKINDPCPVCGMDGE